jgi:hypothetical protein
MEIMERLSMQTASFLFLSTVVCFPSHFIFVRKEAKNQDRKDMSADTEISSRLTGKGLLQATLSFVIYTALMFITYLIAYGDFLDDRFLWEVVLAIGFVGALPLSFQRRWFGFIFLAGGASGLWLIVL